MKEKKKVRKFLRPLISMLLKDQLSNMEMYSLIENKIYGSTFKKL